MILKLTWEISISFAIKKQFYHLALCWARLVPVGRKCKKEEKHKEWGNNHLADINQTVVDIYATLY